MVAKWALSGGVPPPKPPGYFRNHSLRLPLGWDVSLVGVRFGPERERPPGFQKEKKNFKKKFQTGGCFYNFETKYKKINQADSLFVGGPMGLPSWGEPTCEWTGGETLPLLAVDPSH